MKKIISTLFLIAFFFTQSYAQQSLDSINTTFHQHLKLAYQYYDNNKLDSAGVLLQKINVLLDKKKEKTTLQQQRNVLKSTLLIRENKPDEAIVLLLKAQLYFKEQKDSANLGLTLSKLGIANYYVNRREIAKDYFTKVLLHKKHISKRLTTRMHQNIGTINLEIGMVTKDTTLFYQTIKSYNSAIKIYKQENWITDQALATSLLAECYHQLKNYNKALLIIDDAIVLAQKVKNKRQEGFALIKKASYLNAKEKNKEAIKIINDAIPIFKELKDNLTLLYAFDIKKKVLFGLKKYKEATKIGDSIYSYSILAYDTRFADKVSEMDVKYKTAEKEKEIFLQKEELLKNKLKIKNNYFYTTLLAAALLILGIISFGFYKKNQFKRQQLQKEINLKDALSKIKTQNRLQEQRLRISRDLHDNIGSQLTFIISSIDNLKFVTKDANKTLKNKLSTISSFTSDTIFQLRDTIWAMNKNEITSDDLYIRILSFTEKAKLASPNTTFTVGHSVTKMIYFTSIVGVNLFRVIQEAINNALKYANATEIAVHASVEKNILKITVTDNGNGFDITNTTLGNGLTNMEKRMSEINGKLYISSKIKIGTTITISLDLKNTSNAV